MNKMQRAGGSSSSSSSSPAEIQTPRRRCRAPGHAHSEKPSGSSPKTCLHSLRAGSQKNEPSGLCFLLFCGRWGGVADRALRGNRKRDVYFRRSSQSTRTSVANRITLARKRDGVQQKNVYVQGSRGIAELGTGAGTAPSRKENRDQRCTRRKEGRRAFPPEQTICRITPGGKDEDKT